LQQLYLSLILLEFIKLEKNKIAKQFRKSIAFTKFVKSKKISKKSKQVYVNIIDNFDLDILQQILSKYFKDIGNSRKQSL